MAREVLVVGGGAAGCAAAVAAAEAGARVVLLEAAGFLGGVAVAAGHRELCGLAPLDADEPSLLEPALTGPWVAAAATGAPLRRGRVWLWPTEADRLAAACAARCRSAGVDLRLRVRLDALARRDGGYVATAGGSGLRADAVIDASGSGAAAALLGLPCAPATQWGARRAELAVGAETDARWRTRAGQLAALRALADAGCRAGSFLAPISARRWQLTVDLEPGTARAQGAALVEAAAAALDAELVVHAIVAGERDAGRPQGSLGLDELFAQAERGLCWAAWPREEHGPRGVVWAWPPRDRHGIPVAATRPPGAPPDFACVGKGMPVSAAAASALRVTGTCFALGAAVGRLQAR